MLNSIQYMLYYDTISKRIRKQKKNNKNILIYGANKYIQLHAEVIPGLGIRSFAHRSFAHFAQIKWATVS